MFHPHLPVIVYNLLMNKRIKKTGPPGRSNGDFPEAIIHISVAIRGIMCDNTA